MAIIVVKLQTTCGEEEMDIADTKEKDEKDEAEEDEKNEEEEEEEALGITTVVDLLSKVASNAIIIVLIIISYRYLVCSS